MRIVFGGDHAGAVVRMLLADRARSVGHGVIDLGPPADQPVDFPQVTALACSEVVDGHADRAILVCGTGIGAAMAANKVASIRAALAHDVYSAHQCVEHDDANVLCLGAWIVGPELAWELVSTFLAARWDDTEEHIRRVAQLAAMDTVRTTAG
jgi:ribose 5-phosphate isomerase B